jgi:hypothetical protein
MGEGVKARFSNAEDDDHWMAGHRRTDWEE